MSNNSVNYRMDFLKMIKIMRMQKNNARFRQLAIVGITQLTKIKLIDDNIITSYN